MGARREKMADAKSPTICDTCNQPWPEGKQYLGTFARFPVEDPPDQDDIDTLITEQSRLSSFARATFHAIFCVWHYEDQALSGMQWESVESLTTLGQQLCQEIARYETRIDQAARRLKNTSTADEQSTKMPAKRRA
jgi:hypothetical protein